jgi:hypothetical protein
MELIMIIMSGQSNQKLPVCRIRRIATANTASNSPARTQAEVSIRHA